MGLICSIYHAKLGIAEPTGNDGKQIQLSWTTYKTSFKDHWGYSAVKEELRNKTTILSVPSSMSLQMRHDIMWNEVLSVKETTFMLTADWWDGRRMMRECKGSQTRSFILLPYMKRCLVSVSLVWTFVESPELQKIGRTSYLEWVFISTKFLTPAIVTVIDRNLADLEMSTPAIPGRLRVLWDVHWSNVVWWAKTKTIHIHNKIRISIGIIKNSILKCY